MPKAINSTWGRLKKAFTFLGVVLVFFIGTVILVTQLYGDQLINRFLSEANKKILTPIHADKIAVSWWEKFPHISIVLENVVVDGSLPGTTDTLASAQRIYCTFNVWDMATGNWVVDQIHMEEGNLFLVNSELGDNNYTIVKKDISKTEGGVGFEIDRILFKDVYARYLDLRRDQEYLFQVHDMAASLFSWADTYDIHLDGELTSETVRIENKRFFTSKPLAIDSRLTYYEPWKKWDISEALIVVNESSFQVRGFYQGQGDSLNIDIEGWKTDIQTLLSLLPEDTREQYKSYRSKGKIYFKSTIQGLVSEGQSPELSVEFGCENASFFHPRYKKGMEKVNLRGRYESTRANDLSTATLSLRNIKGVMESRPFAGELIIRNLDDSYIKGEFNGTLDLDSWQRFLPPGKITEASGTMAMDVSFEGPLADLDAARSMDNFKASGEVTVTDLDFSLEKNSLPFRDFEGHFLFNGKDLAISDFSGQVGNSDFLINGLFRNIIAFLFSKNQPIGIEADLKAANIDLDELLTGSTKEPEVTVVGKQSYTAFEINPRLALTFDCSIDHMKFRRFRGRKLKGKLLVSDQVARGQHIEVETMGGRITMNGQVNNTKPNTLTVDTKSSYDGIYIDSLFYVFENFNQEFLKDRHLKGQAFAEIDTHMAFDKFLRFKSDQLVVDAGLIIEKGELIDFAPLQKLASFVKRRDLAHLQFADLKNDIHIEDRTIHLPNMVVQSNVSTITVNGTHDFDQDIDYHLKVPLRNPKKDKDEYFGALENDGLNTNLYLKIVGNTSDYRIVYDKQAVKTKIREDLREEKWELRDAIRSKGADDTDQELNEEEYFDFDDPDSTVVQQN